MLDAESERKALPNRNTKVMSEKHQTDNKFIPMLALEKMNKKKDEPVINIVNGGSFGRLNTTNQNMTESTDFQYSLKKAIVSL